METRPTGVTSLIDTVRGAGYWNPPPGAKTLEHVVLSSSGQKKLSSSAFTAVSEDDVRTIFQERWEALRPAERIEISKCSGKTPTSMQRKLEEIQSAYVTLSSKHLMCEKKIAELDERVKLLEEKLETKDNLFKSNVCVSNVRPIRGSQSTEGSDLLFDAPTSSQDSLSKERMMNKRSRQMLDD